MTHRVSSTAPPDVVALRSVGEQDRERVGTKAATLGRLVNAGLAVPEGLVLTADAAASADRTSAAIDAISEHFGDAVLAVRSSAVAEDQPDASYAGQYESVLRVRGRAALAAAVQRCRESARAARVTVYRAGVAADTGAALAVLVQRQVDADVAGVAFSANPVTGGRDEVLVSAAPGLGDAVVDGRQTPDEWVVTATASTAVRVAHQALAEPQARAVAALARRIEGILGGPQDIEWAMAGGRLLVLQARPITALPQPPAVDLPPGTWRKDPARYPEPMTPLGAGLVAETVGAELTAMFADYGGLLERIEMRSVGGEIYARAVPPGGRGGSPPPWWVLAALARVAPPLRRRMRAARRAADPQALAAEIRWWREEERPEIAAATDALRAVDLGALDDAALGQHLDAVLALCRRALHAHFHLIPPHIVPLHELVVAVRELLGWTTAQSLELVAGTSTATSRPTDELAAVAKRIRAAPAARSAVQQAGADVSRALADTDPELAAAFAEWCDRHACRCVNDDPGSPLLAERPWLLAGLLREAVDDPESAAARSARAAATRHAAAERARAQLSGGPRQRFERALEAALDSYPIREETSYWAASRPPALMRLAAVEAGRRLVRRGVLGHPEDAVFLDLDTLRAALAGRGPADVREVVRRARAERAWTAQHPGPRQHGPAPAPLPDLRGLPQPARRLNEALLWAQEGPLERDRSAADRPPGGPVLVGAPGSSGRYTGPVRIVRAEADFGRLGAGEVLVCPTTDPAWSVLFGLAGALVTDGGGLLSHAAIVAREHAIPAVVGVGDATRRLRDGDVVTVDGTTGRVRVDPDPTATTGGDCHD